MYFLLYVDNELSVEQRHAVEAFVAENADLKNELELLLSTALPADEIKFSAKEILYKNELVPDHMREQMLMHLDNELIADDVNFLSVEMAANDELKREWSILQQTKLDATEKIVFEDKQSLYRHEKDNVVTMYFWRVAAAVIIIGIAIFIGISKFGKTNDVKDIASGAGNEKKVKTTQQKPANSKDEKNKLNDQYTAQANETVQPTSTNQVAEEKKLQQQDKKNIVSSTGDNKNLIPFNKVIKQDKQQDDKIANNEERNNEKVIKQKQTNNLPEPYFENINKDKSNKTVIATVQDNMKAIQNKDDNEKPDDKVIAKTDDKQPELSDNDNGATAMTNNYAKNASANESALESSNNSILFLNEEKVNRTKIGGLFRKVRRVLARNTNNKSGNSVRIGGFEIATR